LGDHYRELLQDQIVDLQIPDLENEVKKIEKEIEERKTNLERKDTDILIHRGRNYNKYHLAWLNNVVNGKYLIMGHTLVPGTDNSLFIMNA